jgi:hypothetical protein
MRGSNPMERARVHELLSLIEEAGQAFGFLVMNSSSLFTGKVEQSRGVAAVCEGRMHKLLLTIEGYAGEAVEAGKWLAGTEGATLADVCLASVVEYTRDMYGRDLTRDHAAIGKWLDKWQSVEAGKRGGEKLPPQGISEVAKQWLWDGE